MEESWSEPEARCTRLRRIMTFLFWASTTSTGILGGLLCCTTVAFAQCYGTCSEEEIQVQIRKVLLHEFRHHLESLAGERDLEIEDAVNVSQYKAKKRQEKT